MRSVFLGILLPLLCGVVPVRAGDSLDRLRADPSQGASHRLVELYRNTPDPDQRFWIIHALGARLNAQSDPSALDALILAAEDEKAVGVRVPAMRALADYSSGSKREIPQTLLVRLDAVVHKGIKAPSTSVRESAENLGRALKLRRDPSASKTPLPPEGGGRRRRLLARLAQMVRWLWLALLPIVVAGWALLGLPVFDSLGQEGPRARMAWGVLRTQWVFLAVTIFLWLCLSAILAGYGFDLVVLALGRTEGVPYEGWVRAYYCAGLCVFLPGVLLAGAHARHTTGSAAVTSIGLLPGALTLWAVVFTVLVPLEILYRIFLRGGARDRTRDEAGLLSRILESGALRSGFFASSVMARENMGLLPAFRRAAEALTGSDEASLGLGAFDLRFALLCAAPFLAFFCALIAKGQAVEWEASMPVVVLGCALWSWAVLSGVLYAVVKALEGALVAGLYRERLASEVEEWGEI